MSLSTLGTPLSLVILAAVAYLAATATERTTRISNWLLFLGATSIALATYASNHRVIVAFAVLGSVLILASSILTIRYICSHKRSAA